MYVGAPFDQKLDQLDVSIHGGVMKRRVVLVALRVDVGPRLHQPESNLVPAVVARFMQRRPPCSKMTKFTITPATATQNLHALHNFVRYDKLPAKSVALGSARCANNLQTCSTSPLIAAKCNGVSPLSFRSLDRDELGPLGLREPTSFVEEVICISRAIC